MLHYYNWFDVLFLSFPPLCPYLKKTGFFLSFLLPPAFVNFYFDLRGCFLGLSEFPSFIFFNTQGRYKLSRELIELSVYFTY